jgi:hypothetical protein
LLKQIRKVHLSTEQSAGGNAGAMQLSPFSIEFDRLKGFVGKAYELASKLALLWQNLAIDRRYWIPESGFQ